MRKKFGIRVEREAFSKIMLIKEFKEKYEPLTHGYQHYTDQTYMDVLFEAVEPEVEKEILEFFISHEKNLSESYVKSLLQKAEKEGRFK